MSIFSDIFTSKPAAQEQPAAQSAPTAQPQVTPPGTNIQDPAAVAAQSSVDSQLPVAPASDPNLENKEDAPLSQFAHLWENEPNKDEQTPATPAPLNADDVRKVVAKTDFSSVITPEMLESIPEEQRGTFSQAMNLVAQQVMVQATMVGNKLTEQAVTAAKNEFSASLPALLRQQASTDHLKTSNPLFDNPAIKPVAQATQAQLLQKFPNATHAEITKMTEDFIMSMGAEFAPKLEVNNNSADAEVDWDAFMNS